MTEMLAAQLDQLSADREARRARLAAIGPEEDALRLQLRRARGEAELGDAAAGKRVGTLERQLATLDTERDALEGAVEILDERVADAEAALAAAMADEREQIAAACRKAEEDAFAELEAVLRRIVQPLQRMAAARHVAFQHGVRIADRAEAIRIGLAGAAIPGIPPDIATGAAGAAAFLPGHVAAVEALLRELRDQGVPVGKVALPELDPELKAQLEWKPPIQRSDEAPVEVRPDAGIHMGRNAPVEVDKHGRPIEQAAQPSLGYRPAKPMASFQSGRPAPSQATEAEYVAAFPRR